VTIVEPGAPGGVATPASFAWINATWGNPEPYFRFRMRAIAEWTRLAAAVPGIELAWMGGLCWDLSPADLAAFVAEHGSWGYGIRRVDRDEAARLEPNLMDPPEFAVHVPGEGAVEPAPAARALIAAAVRDGAKLMTGEHVLALAVENGRVVGVSMAGGILRADEVVLAAGIASPDIAATAGIGMSLDTPPGLLIHSRPHARLLNGLVLGERAHMRQTAEGRIVAGSDFGGADPGIDAADTARLLFAETQAMLRGGDALELDFHTLGYRPTPADGFPMIGRFDGVDGLYVTVMHSGITLAPIVGLLATQELTTGERDLALAPYRPSRFAQ
jgi:glycine/D-amino acid oxidase-like deaminating enzyme